jgi:hypothetical protein
MTKIVKACVVGFGALCAAGAMMSGQQPLAVAHATPNADSIEEEGVCEILDNSGGDYRWAFGMAVMAVKGDTDMNDSDATRFARQAINDRCPVYKQYLS